MIIIIYSNSSFVAHRSYWMVVALWSLVTSVCPRQTERHWRIYLPCSLHLRRQGKEIPRRTLTIRGKDYMVRWQFFLIMSVSIYIALLMEKLASRLAKRNPKMYNVLMDPVESGHSLGYTCWGKLIDGRGSHEQTGRDSMWQTGLKIMQRKTCGQLRNGSVYNKWETYFRLQQLLCGWILKGKRQMWEKKVME